jgi:uncharacterized membrane protein YgdD (TMEM256/DUF423 family)
MDQRIWLIIASMVMAINIGLGALGTHFLKSRLSTAALETFHTANYYHMVHGLGLLLIAILLSGSAGSFWYKISGALFLLGLCLFSGVLYLHSLELLGKGWHILIPFGGLSFIIGWVCLGVGALLQS